MIIRYEGLPAHPDIPKLMQGHGVYNTGEAHDIKTSRICGHSFLLGWNSILRCDHDGTQFQNIRANIVTALAALPVVGQSRQLVTRGVDTCTAIAIRRGSAYVFLHLDGDQAANTQQNVIDAVTAHIQPAAGAISVVSSYIDDDDEIAFVGRLVEACKALGEVLDVGINRNAATPEGWISHIEFGIAVEENAPCVYGDYVDRKLNKLIDNQLIFPLSTT